MIDLCCVESPCVALLPCFVVFLCVVAFVANVSVGWVSRCYSCKCICVAMTCRVVLPFCFVLLFLGSLPPHSVPVKQRQICDVLLVAHLRCVGLLRVALLLCVAVLVFLLF